MLKKLLQFLGSIKLAVPLLVTIGSILIFATFYESQVGTKTVQEMIYKSPWFGGLMFLLAINLAVSALSRYPWRTPRKIGFALTHLGLIVIIAGSAAVIHVGVEGLLLLRTDRAANDQMRMDGEIVEVLTPDQSLQQQELFVDGDGSVNPDKVGNLRLLKYADNTVKTVDFQSTEGVDNLAVRLQLSSDRMGQNLTRWLALAPIPYREIELGPANLEIMEVDGDEALQSYLSNPSESANDAYFQVLVTPSGELYYASKSSNSFHSGQLKPNQPVASGWADFQVTVAEIVPHAELQRQIVPVSEGNSEEQSSPGLLVQTTDGDLHWLRWSEPKRLMTPEGETYVTFSPHLEKLPFAIALDDFIVERNEGSQSVAMWTSEITIHDKETGETVEREVWMNHPTWYKGWKIAQASWNPGDLEQSTLQIKREPVWVTLLTFGGSGLVVLGIAVMFYGPSVMQKLSKVFSKDSKDSSDTSQAVQVN